MESPTTLYGLPFKKNPRDGQREVFKKITEEKDLHSLNIQLPTGYGKSFVAAGVYSILKKQNRANRLLIIVPTSAQNEQYLNDKDTFIDACIDGNKNPIDLAFHKEQSYNYHRKNTHQIYISTIQALLSTTGYIISEMMHSGQWLIVIDEYHHYGKDKAWGNIIKNLPYSFLLAMSATPYRKSDDGLFGGPNIVVNYRTGVEEKAIKPLQSHSYIYTIDTITSDGIIFSMTTNDLIREVGSDKPNKMEKYIIEKKMRLSPKYISPLIYHPIDRMLLNRMESGYKLQAIFGAMFVSHAKQIYEQIKSMYPELSVDWVGTGNFGRDDATNKKIINSFCPPKDPITGQRNPTLDILVHVGIAGEGLDCVNVSEIIHVNKAAINNSNNQENGRASRYLPGIIGNINFDSCSEYAQKGYIGSKIMDAMDDLPPNESETTEIEHEEKDYNKLPDEPNIGILNCELKEINHGEPGFMRMAGILADMCNLRDQLGDVNSELHRKAELHYKKMRDDECAGHNEKVIITRWHENLNYAARHVAGLVVKLSKKNGIRIDKSLIGDIKKRINCMKKRKIGPVVNDIEIMKLHYYWIKELESELLSTREVPLWLQ